MGKTAKVRDLPAPAELAMRRFQEEFTKAFGEGSLIRAEDLPAYRVIPTGSLALDYASGVGGYVRGRLHEIWGADGNGKTSMALLGCAQAQATSPEQYVAWIDVEHRLDKTWARTLGVDLTRLDVHPPKDAEDVADALRKFADSGLYSMIVVDSVAAMIPKVEMQKMAEDAVVARQAQIVTRMVKIAAPTVRRTDTAVLLLNQVRANVSGYGKPTTTGGGWALRHSTTMKFEFRRSGEASLVERQPDGNAIPVGQEIAIKVERNSVAPAGRVANVVLLTVASRFGTPGIDQLDEAVGLAIQTGVLAATSEGGAWYALGEAKLQGREQVKEHLRRHPALLAQLREKVVATRAHEIVEGN